MSGDIELSYAIRFSDDPYFSDEDEDAPDQFPQPSRRDGEEPCGECHLQPGETCDICGAKAERLPEAEDQP